MPDLQLEWREIQRRQLSQEGQREPSQEPSGAQSTCPGNRRIRLHPFFTGYHRSYEPPRPPRLPPPLSAFLAARHSLQRFGSLMPFCWKNSCSPCEKVKDWPQSEQRMVLSGISSILWEFSFNQSSKSQSATVGNRESSGDYSPLTCTTSRSSGSYLAPVKDNISAVIPFGGF